MSASPPPTPQDLLSNAIDSHDFPALQTLLLSHPTLEISIPSETGTLLHDILALSPDAITFAAVSSHSDFANACMVTDCNAQYPLHIAVVRELDVGAIRKVYEAFPEAAVAKDTW